MMLKNRVIPVLLLKNGLLVRSEGFDYHQYIGNPYHEVKRYNEWNIDELIYLDISDEGAKESSGRSDNKILEILEPLELLPIIAKNCFVPLTFGGKIRTIEDVRQRIKLGADKVAINSKAIEDPSFVTEVAKIFGSQCIVVCIDVFKNDRGNYTVLSKGGTIDAKMDPVTWAKIMEEAGAGEILLQSVNNDGRASGYDIGITKDVVEAVSIPVIALGGAGEYSDFTTVLNETNTSAVAAANIFHFKELSDRHIKRELSKGGIMIRQ